MRLQIGILFFLTIFNIQTSLAQKSIDKIAIVGANVISIKNDSVLSNQTILIENNIIQKIGDKKNIRIPDGYSVINTAGKYVIPGLSDMHVHLYSEGELMIYLSFGITQVFNLDGKPPAHLAWKIMSTTKNYVFPTIYSCGPKFDGQWSVEESAKKVIEQKNAGYDGIKIYNGITDSSFDAVMEKAKETGMIVVGHIARATGWRKTLLKHQNIAHLEEFIYTYFNDSVDLSKIDSLVYLIKESNVSVIPTISTYRHIVKQATDVNKYLQTNNFSLLLKPLLQKRLPDRNLYAKGFSNEEKLMLPRFLDLQKKMLSQMFKKDINIVSGTDAPDVGPVPGFGLLEELKMYKNTGATEYQVLKTTTVNAAKLLEKENEWGTIEPGMKASLLVLNSNPLENIQALKSIWGLYHNGNWFTAIDLKKLREKGIEHFENKLNALFTQSSSDIANCLNYLNQNDPYQVFSAALLAKIASTGWKQIELFISKINIVAPDSELISERTLNALGYNLASEKKWELAEKIFLLNISRHPKSANVFDSMAEFYSIQKDDKKAIAYYQKALNTNPTYPNADFARKYIKEHN